MDFEMILYEKENGIATVTLNRPEKLNALTPLMRVEMRKAFEDVAADDGVRVLILTGAGRAFTAGLDLKELGGEIDPDVAAVSDRAMDRAIAQCGKPIIGAINGYAITGGFEIALMCDFLIASTEARFADTHARVGVVPGWGLSQKLPRLIGINRAKELSLTGNFLAADQACAWGLVNRVVPPEELLPTCKALARDIISTDPATRNEIRRIMDQGWYSTLGEGLAIEQEANRAHAQRELTPDKVAARRAGIQARGRSQSH